MPEDELLCAACVDHRWRAVTGLARIERTPEFFAGILVKSHRDTARTASEADEALSIEQRMTGETPLRRFGSVVCFKIVRPEDFAVFGVEAEQVSLRAERPDLAIAHQRRAARPGGVAHRVGAVVAMLPELRPGLCIKAEAHVPCRE
jgi:hypothetical protein